MSDEKKPTGSRNGMFTRDEMRKAFGVHPMADWKPKISKSKGKWWLKPKPEE